MADSSGVVVGWDGSPGAEAAVDWAAAEADRRGVPLTVLFASSFSGILPGPVGPSAWLPEVALEDARAVVDGGAARARSAAPDLTVRTAVDTGPPARSLIEASRSVELMVVGSRGRGEVLGDLLGSVATAVVGHARCPVAVVRGDGARRPGPGSAVVVGVDGSAPAGEALDTAADLADAQAAELSVVVAWRQPSTAPWETRHWTAMHPDLDPDDAARRTADQVVTAAVARARDRRPGLAVTGRAVEGPAGRVLADAAADAGLLVVGSRGHGGFAALVLGSVARAVAHSSPCPVLVVHPRTGGDATPASASAVAGVTGD